MKHKNKVNGKMIAVLVLMAIMALVLVACGGSDPEPTAVPEAESETSEAEPTEAPPTEVPPAEVPPTEVPPTEVPPTEVPAVEESGSPLDTMEHTVDPNLVNKTWAWESRDPNGNIAF